MLFRAKSNTAYEKVKMANYEKKNSSLLHWTEIEWGAFHECLRIYRRCAKANQNFSSWAEHLSWYSLNTVQKFLRLVSCWQSVDKPFSICRQFVEIDWSFWSVTFERLIAITRISCLFETFVNISGWLIRMCDVRAEFNQCVA